MSKVFGKEPSMNLYKMILELKDLDECYRFFQDLCTVSELVYQGEYTIDNNGMQCPKGTEKDSK